MFESFIISLVAMSLNTLFVISPWTAGSMIITNVLKNIKQSGK